MNDIEKGQLSQVASQCFSRADGSLSDFPGLLKRVITERVWEHRIHHSRVIELGSLRELITMNPIHGWGQDPKKIEAVIRDDAEALAMYRQEMLGEEGGDKRSEKATTNNNIISEPAKQGTSRAYTLTRLKKTAPELFEKVCAGELSANAAAIEAGFRKKKTPLDTAKAAVSKMSEGEEAELWAWLERRRGGARKS